MKFIINSDLNNIRFTFHNSIHFFIALIFTYIFGFLICYGVLFLWEVGDGYKNWYYDFNWNPETNWFSNKFRQEFLYSDKFSLQDIFVWNLSGSLIGFVLKLTFGVLHA